MEILIDPNVAYLLLVVGIVLAIMALFAPGTGILEIGALFVLFLAGWEMSQLPINLWALVLLILGVIPFILAVRKSRNLVFLVDRFDRFCHWFRLPVSRCKLVAARREPIPGDHRLSCLPAVISGLPPPKCWKPKKCKPRHDLAKIIGDIGEAKTDIYNEGSVQIGSELWSARSSVPIPEGSKVRVVKREGFILEVEPVPPKERVNQLIRAQNIHSTHSLRR